MHAVEWVCYGGGGTGVVIVMCHRIVSMCSCSLTHCLNVYHKFSLCYPLCDLLVDMNTLRTLMQPTASKMLLAVSMSVKFLCL